MGIVYQENAPLKKQNTGIYTLILCYLRSWLQGLYVAPHSLHLTFTSQQAIFENHAVITWRHLLASPQFSTGCPPGNWLAEECSQSA